VLSNNGAGLVSDRGGGVISDQGGGLVSNNGGSAILPTRYHLRALEEVPVRGARVTLLTADGKPVLGPDGAPVVALTGPDGGYAFDAALPGRHLVVEVRHPSGGEAVTAIAPPQVGGRAAVDVNLVSTLVSGYILDQFVRTQPDPVTTLAKLPADQEQRTRDAARDALMKVATPTDLAPATVVRAVQALRSNDVAFNGQMEVVKQLLLAAGQSDFGNGLPATTVALGQVHGVVPTAGGSVYLYTSYERRVRRVTPDGKLVTAAGKGQYAPGAFDHVPGPEAGLGEVIAIAGDGAEGLLIVDQSETGAQRTSHLAVDGSLTTLPGASSVVLAGLNGEIWALQTPEVEGGAVALRAIAPTPRLIHTFDATASRALAGAGRLALDAAGRLVVSAGMLDATPDDVNREAVLRFDTTTWAPTTLWVAPKFDPEEGVPFDSESPKLDDRGNVFLVPGLVGYGATDLVALENGARRMVADVSTIEAGEHGISAVAQGPNGVVYVATFGGRVYKADASGKLVPFAGMPVDAAAGTTADALSFTPTGIALLANGDMLLTNTRAGVVLRVGSDKVVTTLVGNPERAVPGDTGDGGPAVKAGLGDPHQLGVDAQGRIYVATYDRVRRVDPDGTIRSVYVREPDDSGWGGIVRLLVTLPDGTCYVGGNDVEATFFDRVGPDGKRTPVPATFLPPRAFRYAVDPAGALYAFTLGDGRPWRLGGPGGPVPLTSPGVGLGDNTFEFAVDAKGRCYGAGEQVIRRLDPATGKLEIIAGAGGRIFAGSGVDDSLDRPDQMRFDAGGNLYVIDGGHRQVKRIPAQVLEP
jgi:hypothetical protein